MSCLVLDRARAHARPDLRPASSTAASIARIHASRASGVSASKLNDFKPMLGEAFASDLLQPYDWWGYLQEDLLIGNLSRLATPAFLADADASHFSGIERDEFRRQLEAGGVSPDEQATEPDTGSV